ncbi:unnamed protein product, partial [Oppiella nova]
MATDSDNKLRQIEDIKHKTQAVIDDRKNVNNLVDVLTVLTDDLDQTRGDSGDKCSPLMVDTIIRSLNKIFIRYIHTKELVISDGDTDANLTYKKWLTGVYHRTNDTLLRLIGDNRYSKATQKLALNSLMKCVAEEGKYPFRTDIPIDRKDTFAADLLNDICRQLVSATADNRQLIANYIENYLEFDDC